MGRPISEKELFYDRLGPRFAKALSDYDTRRRVEVLVGQFLTRSGVAGRRTLDVGCGLGFFTEAMLGLGADVVATDLAPSLVRSVRERLGCKGEIADALELEAQFGAAAFDIVISSECIEHTPDPEAAIRQMCRVLKPGGYLSISTPNVLWYPVVFAASRLRMREFDGIEKFNRFGRMRRVMEEEGMTVLSEYGLHLFPFQLGLHRLSTWCDDHLQALRVAMIDLCILGRKG